jgi:hypothetical protein
MDKHSNFTPRTDFLENLSVDNGRNSNAFNEDIQVALTDNNL